MSSFRFKQFSVRHEASMKIGTDAVVLGAWVPEVSGKRLLDIGTGSGILALMCAQRGATEIIGIDIDNEAVAEAKLNVEQSPWREKIEIIHRDFRDATTLEVLGSFDLIISNPPFFIGSLKSPQMQRNTARHAESLPFNQLIDNALTLLRLDGQLALILPIREAEIFRQQAMQRQLLLERFCDILPYPSAPPNRRMMIFRRAEQVTVAPACETLVLRNADHRYSEHYIRLTEDFYLDLSQNLQGIKR